MLSKTARTNLPAHPLLDAPGTILALPSPIGTNEWRWYVHGCACAPGKVARWHESENEAQLCAMRVKVDAVLGVAVDVPRVSGGVD